jgi:glycosyltransferase involved in cell wall biosynthesis
MRLTVLVPAYNEEKTILEVLRKVRAQRIVGVDLEIVVVDDGSNDRSVALLEEHPALYDTLVRMPKNGGKGSAVRAGLAKATGDYVLFQDADLEYDPADYAALVTPVLRFGADVVMGSRMVGAPWSRVHYFWNKQGNNVITLLFNLFYNTTFTDTYSCYLLYRRSLLDPGELESNGWEQHAEILCRVISRSRVWYEVPVTYAGRTYDEGKKIRPQHAIAVIARMAQERFRLWRDSAPSRAPLVTRVGGEAGASPRTNGRAPARVA